MDAVEERHVESGLDVCYAKEQGEEKDKDKERKRTRREKGQREEKDKERERECAIQLDEKRVDSGEGESMKIKPANYCGGEY